MAKKKNLTFVEKMSMLRNAGLSHRGAIAESDESDYADIESLELRIKKILDIVDRNHVNPQYMLFFVMYDIENNKVRTLVSKYLETKGCQRVQKSIFFAETERKTFNEIKSDLLEVQKSYNNSDSILIVPVSTDQLRAMKVIGQNIDFDIVVKNRNTLFF